MEKNETIEKTLFECKKIIEAQRKQITKKIKKEKALKLVDGTPEYITALQDLNSEFVSILIKINKVDATKDRQYFIDALREKFRILWLQYNKCSDYDNEKKSLEKLLTLLAPFISTTQKEFEQRFLKNIKGKIEYDSSRLSFEEFSGEVQNYMSLSNSFQDFSDETAKMYQKFNQLFKNIQRYIKLINTTKSADEFHEYTHKFLNLKREFKQLAQNFDEYIATFDLDFSALDEEVDPTSQHETQTNNVLESTPVDFSSLAQATEEDLDTEQTAEESLEQLLALKLHMAETSTKKCSTEKFEHKESHEITVKHEDKPTWQERRFDGYARLLHRTLLALHQKPGAVSATIDPNSKHLLISTASNLDEKIIAEAITKITEASNKLEKRLAGVKISLKKHITERANYLKELNIKLKNPKQPFNMVPTDHNTPSEYQKFIFLIKNVRMDLDLAKFSQATQKTMSEQRYFADLHNAITTNGVLIVKNLNLLHPEQAIADHLLQNTKKKITAYIGSTIKNCKKCHALFNGHPGLNLNGLNEASSLLQVKTSGFFNYGYPNTYLPAYTRKFNQKLSDTEISLLLDQASPYSAKKAEQREPRTLFVAQQPDLSDSETELELMFQAAH